VSRTIAAILVLCTFAILLFGVSSGYLQVAVGIIATISAVAAILKLHTSGPKIRLQLDDDRQARGYHGGDPYLGWRVGYTFVNDGERIGRVFDSFAKLVLSGEVRNVVTKPRPFGPNSDFFVEPDRPVIGQVDLDIEPQTPGPSWMQHYIEAVRAGRLTVKIEINWKYGDVAKRNVKTSDLITLNAPLFSTKTR
jgi:hypothetical protein